MGIFRNSKIYWTKKNDFKIEKQVLRHCVQYSECLSIPLPYYATQIISPFLISMISANHDKGKGF